MERLFNALPYKLQSLKNLETDTLKKYVDLRQRTIPDTSKIDGYGASVLAQGVHYKDRSKSKGDLRIYMDILGDFKDLNSIDFKYSASSL